MQYFGKNEDVMLEHVAHAMCDQIAEQGGYEDEDTVTVEKIGEMAKAGSSVVLTGAEMTAHELDELMRHIVRAEVANWVPDASQRLLSRSFAALGYAYGSSRVLTTDSDCGLEPGWHALIRDWILGDTYLRCVTCGRLYPEG